MRLIRKNSFIIAICLIALTSLMPVTSTFAAAKRRAAASSRRAGKTRARGGRASSRSAASTSRRLSSARKRAEARRLAALRRAIAHDNAMKTATRASIERDDTRGEDPQVRQAILSALNGHAGTVVGMDPRTGRVYSMVNQQLGVHAAFKPCSTIKLVVGLAGLHENEIGSSGILELTGGDYRMGLTDALAHSDNGYFQEVGEKLGYERVLEYARDFGLGEPTGLNTTGETGGLIPLRIPPRGITFMSSHGDGFAVTTLQLASLTSAIVNGGYLYKPQILRTDKEISGFKPSLRRKIEVSDADRARVLEGMMGSAAFGTGKSSATQGALVAGKTGTCSDEVSKIGLYTSVNNVDNPTLALAVIVRGSSERGASAATIAGEVYRQLAPRFNIALTRPRRVTEGTRASSGSDK